MQDIVKKVEELGLALPAVAAPLAAYVPATRAGDIIFVSGQLPSVNGDFSAYTGIVPDALAPEKAKEGAAICFLNNLAAALSKLQDGESLKLVQLQGFVQSNPEFKEQPAILNGASELAVQILGDNGKHARTAVGVAALPKNAGVEVSCTFQVIKSETKFEGRYGWIEK